MCASYVLEGQHMAERAGRHVIQKAFRDLNARTTINNLTMFMKWDGALELDRFPEVKAAIKEFTSKKGKEKNWSEETLAGQLNSVAKKYGDRIGGFLAFTRLFMHRNASEIAHGSLFSIWWYLGFTVPGEYPVVSEDFELITRDKAALALFVLNFCVYTMIAVVSKEHSQVQFERRSDAVLREMLMIFDPKREK
jgi:hypothetical protein